MKISWPWLESPEVWQAYCAQVGRHSIACEREYKKNDKVKSKFFWFQAGYYAD